MKKKAAKTTARDIEFLYEIGTLRNFDRQHVQHYGLPCANNLEHSFRVAFLALMLARKEGIKNEEKVLKMALLHDLAETRVGDIGYVQKVYVTADEERAAADLFANTVFEDLQKEVLHEYKARKSPESKVVKDADNLDVDIEIKELEERGSLLPKKLKANRRIIRTKKLYTKSAKEFWDALQKSDVASWHLLANKWYKIPTAGR